MKPFNLEEAKAGKPVQTRTGKSARIICFDAVSPDGNESLIALIQDGQEEQACKFYNNGRFITKGETEYDLVMKVEQWEPEGGNYFVDLDGLVTSRPSHAANHCFGIKRKTKELAEAAAIKMRQHNRLLAYVDEACGGYEFKLGKDNYTVYLNSSDGTQEGRWEITYGVYHRYPGVVYMPEKVAEELAKKLNSREVVL